MFKTIIETIKEIGNLKMPSGSEYIKNVIKVIIITSLFSLFFFLVSYPSLYVIKFISG